MGPDELDDLLASIRAESKKESALALYSGKRETDVVSEEVDERILRLLGLDQVFDIDYGTYLSLLKEKLVQVSAGGAGLAREEEMLLRQEFQGVRGKVGRFKIRRKRVSSSSIGVSGPIQISKEKFFLTTKAIAPVTQDTGGGVPPEQITSIEQKLDELLKSIIDQNKVLSKKEKEERRKVENRRRAEREKELESFIKPAQRLLQKVVRPFQSILDRIMKFIGFTLLGFAFNKFLNWYADPKNQKKIQAISRFLKDWWPSLLTAAGLFFTPFGKFVRGTIKLVKFFLPVLKKLAKVALSTRGGRIGTVALAAGGGLAALIKQQTVQDQRQFLINQVEKNNQVNKYSGGGLISSPSGKRISSFYNGGIVPPHSSGVAIPKFYNGGIVPSDTSTFKTPNIPFFGGGMPSFVNVRDLAFNNGGFIDRSSGLNIIGAGPDTQLIAAQPGEIVISKNAVDTYGANFFLDLNKAAGGTNIPRMVNNIQLASGGGMVGGSVPRAISSPRISLSPVTNMLKMSSGRRSTSYPSIGSRSTSGRFNFNRPMASRRQSYSPSSFMKLPSGSMASPSRSQSTYIGSSRSYSASVRPVINTQVRVSPPGTPVVSNETQFIMLPPTTSVTKKPLQRNIPGTGIPEFRIVSNSNPYRSVVSTALGISDLV